MSSQTEHSLNFNSQCAICGLSILKNSAVAIYWRGTDSPDEMQSSMAHKSCLASVLHSGVPHNLSLGEAKAENNNLNAVMNGEAEKQLITLQDGFWVAWYYLKQIFENTGGTFDLSDVLSASEPFFKPDQPADSAMTEYWLEAYERFLKEGIPPLKELK
jgi:hypothetical protein